MNNPAHKFETRANICRRCGLPAWAVAEADLSCGDPKSHPRKVLNLAALEKMEGRARVI